LHSDTVVTSLDLLIRILEDPSWKERAKKVKTLKEMRQIILDFCETNGRTVRLDEDILYTFVENSR
jgi:hypothetical protein